MYNALRRMGGSIPASGAGAAQLQAIQIELTRLKSAPILNPHYNMVQTYLDCLNRFIDIAIATNGPAGFRTWLVEVQMLIAQLQKRYNLRVPLTPGEKQALLNFAAYWRSMQAPSYSMQSGEAQVVLITLTEFAMRCG